MRQPALRKHVEGSAPDPRQESRATRPREADAALQSATPSPARDLQARLQAEMEAADGLPAISGRWSARQTLAFAVGTSLLLWGGIGWLASKLLT